MKINIKYAYYIAGLFDGEGCVDKRTLIITNTHKKIIDTASFYLNSLNIPHTISIYKPQQKNYLMFYRIKIYGRINLERFYTYIPFIHREKRRKMLKETMIYKPRKVTEKVYKQIIKLKNQNLSLRKIGKILKLGLGTITYFINKRKY